MEMKIRPAIPSDELSLTSISFGAKRYWNYSEKYLRDCNDDLTVTKDYILKNQVYVAQSRDTIMGYFAIVEYDEDCRDGNVVYTKGYWLDRIYVRAGYIQSGVGRELIKFAENLCKDKAINKLSLYSDILVNGFYNKIGATYIKDCPSKIENQIVSLFEIDINNRSKIAKENENKNIEANAGQEIATTTMYQLNHKKSRELEPAWDIQIPGLELSEEEIAELTNPNLNFSKAKEESKNKQELPINNEKQKMLSGDLYIEWGDEFINDRKKAKELLNKLNSCNTLDKVQISKIAGELFGQTGEYLHIESDFICDYGYNINLGNNVFIGSRCTINDSGKVEIKDNCIISPDVKMYTLAYPLDNQDRESGYEYACPITIGKNVWIGGAAIISPGVTIGDNSVILPGSVVTKSVIKNVLVGGNPAQVIKEIDED